MNQLKLFEEEKDYTVISNSFYPDSNVLDFQYSLMDRVKPYSRNKKLEKAINYVWENPLLFRIIKMKVDFVSSGFKVIHEDDKVNKFYNDLYDELDIDTFIKNMAFYYFTVGESYPFYTWDNNKPRFATLLDPKLVKVKSALGKDFIYLYPSETIKKIIYDDDEVTKEFKKLIPAKYIEKWKNGEAVYLKDAERYTNLKEYRENYAHSPIEPIFPDLEIFKSLQEADFSASRRLKQLLLHVKIGDSKFNNAEPVPKKVLDDVKDYWENPSRSLNIYSQWFVDADYIKPPLELFENKKYESVVSRILQWSGTEVMFSSDSSYSEGSIRVKGLKQSIINAQNEVRKCLNNFNKEVAKRNNLTYYSKLKIPRILFDNNALSDPQRIAEIIKFAYNMGGVSLKTLNDKAGIDFEMEMKQKEIEKEKYYEQIGLIFEPSQNQASKSNEDNNTENNNNQPRPGKE
ncbi:MAG: hypothetical protein ACOCRK_02605 [bacterium]